MTAGAASDGGSGDRTPSVKANLRDVHLPKLVSGGYVEWDLETRTVRCGPNFEEIAPVVADAVEREDAVHE